MIKEIGVLVPLKTDVLIFLKDVFGVPKSVLDVGMTYNQF